MGRSIRLSEAQLSQILAQAPATRVHAPSVAKPVKPDGQRGNMSPVQALLWADVRNCWPEAVPEYGGAVPGRHYTLDIAFVALRLAVEVDGWQYHGKHLQDFKRDREKDRLLLLEGWRVLRFYAGEIRRDRARVLAQIEQARSLILAGH